MILAATIIVCFLGWVAILCTIVWLDERQEQFRGRRGR